MEVIFFYIFNHFFLLNLKYEKKHPKPCINHNDNEPTPSIGFNFKSYCDYCAFTSNSAYIA